MKKVVFPFLLSAFFIAGCGNSSSESSEAKSSDMQASDSSRGVSITETPVTYTADSATLQGFLAYDENKKGKRPVVLVVHEWWGLNDYVRRRAKQLAEMGYLAMAVDMYGSGKTAANPQEAMTLATPFYKDPQLAKARLEAALREAYKLPQADSSRAAAIGYCFGGSVVLNNARLGTPLKGVVSFHGGLSGAPTRKDLLQAAVLVCHGAADNFVPPAEVAAFKKSMDSVGADYTFKEYAGATHAFTNPDATEVGKKFEMPIRYDGAADTASWNDMKAFLARIFP